MEGNTASKRQGAGGSIAGRVGGHNLRKPPPSLLLASTALKIRSRLLSSLSKALPSPAGAFFAHVSCSYSQPQPPIFEPSHGFLGLSAWKTQTLGPLSRARCDSYLLRCYFLLIQVASLVRVYSNILLFFYGIVSFLFLFASFFANTASSKQQVCNKHLIHE